MCPRTAERTRSPPRCVWPRPLLEGRRTRSRPREGPASATTEMIPVGHPVTPCRRQVPKCSISAGSSRMTTQRQPMCEQTRWHTSTPVEGRSRWPGRRTAQPEPGCHSGYSRRPLNPTKCGAPPRGQNLLEPARSMTLSPRSPSRIHGHCGSHRSALDALPQSRYSWAVEFVHIGSAPSHAHHQREGRSGDQQSGTRDKRPIICAQP